MNDLRTYFPPIYKEILEFNAIAEAENLLFYDLNNETVKAKNNQYIMTCDINGIKQYEKMLNITANPTIEGLQFRKERIINRLSLTPPFTFGFLKNRLDEIIGVGEWNAYIDYAKYILYIESSATNQIWFHEILVTINRLKPANIIFINKPFVADNINAGETINLNEVIANYKLGTTWILGKKPFKSLEDKGVIKLSNVPSVKDELLNTLAAEVESDIAKVRINDTFVITNLDKTIMDNSVTVEYEIALESGIVEVTKIELLDADDNTLTESIVYVPILESIILKHIIRIKEGA